MKDLRIKNQFGFTLVEVLVYLGLFALLIGGALIAAYNVVESGGRNQSHAQLQQEGNFLIGKINWTLSGISDVNLPACSASPCDVTASKLQVAKSDLAVGAVDIYDDATHTNMLIKRLGADYQLNNADVSVSNLQFNHQHPTGGAEWVTATFTLSTRTPNGQILSQDFTTTKYLRK